MAIASPPEWGWNTLKIAARSIGSSKPDDYWHARRALAAPPRVRRIGAADLVEALRRGRDDFMAHRTDVLVLCVIYPLLGLIIGRLASGNGFLPLVFPLASGFALIGPLAAVGLNEMSRRREEGGETSWSDAFGVLRSPSIGAIALLGLLLVAAFLLWVLSAEMLYVATLGAAPPGSLTGFLHDAVATPAGWTMIVVGIGTGFVFAVVVLSISVVSFPLLLDRYASIDTAVSTSLRVMRTNPGVMALWGAMIAGGLVLGSAPALLGLTIVLPVLGHATWHLYRRVVLFD